MANLPPPEQPEALTADGEADGSRKLDGAERMRLGRRMMVGTERTGRIKVWSTSILDIIKFARKISPTVKALALDAAGALTYTTTDDKTTTLGNIKGEPGRDGKDGDPGAPGSPGQPGTAGKDGTNGTNGKDGLSIKGDTGPSALVDLGQITIAQSATLVAIALGPRIVTVSGITGLLKGDHVILTPLDPFPTGGWLVCQAVPRANGVLDVYITGPLLALGASYSFKARVGVLR